MLVCDTDATFFCRLSFYLRTPKLLVEFDHSVCDDNFHIQRIRVVYDPVGHKASVMKRTLLTDSDPSTRRCNESRSRERLDHILKDYELFRL